MSAHKKPRIFPEALESARSTYLESLRVRSFSTATLAVRGESLDGFYRFLCHRGIDDLREVSADTIRDYQLYLSQQIAVRTGKPFAVRTLHVMLLSVQHFFDYLEKTDAILVNPCLKIVLPKLDNQLPRNVLSASQVKAILNAPDTQTRKGIRDRAILEVFYSTGIRLQEMARLTIHDIDTRNGFLRVHKGKGGKDRVVPLGKKACQYVREYLEKIRSEWTKENRDQRALWLQHRRPYRPIQDQSVSVMVRAYGRKVGVRVSPHVWRHTCATHLMVGGSNIAYVQRLLGHRSLQTTQIYARASLSEVRKTFARSHPRA